MKTTLLPATGRLGGGRLDGLDVEALAERIEDRAVLGFGDELDGRPGDHRANPVDVGQCLQALALRRGSRFHRRPPLFDGAVATSEQARRRLADVADAQRVDEAVERDAPAGLDGAEEVGGRGLAPALQLGELRERVAAVLLLQVEDVRRAPHPTLGVECLDLLGAETLDVEGVAGDEVAQPLQRLGRANQTAGAAAHRLPLLPHRVAAALRADGGRVERLALRRPLLLDHADDLRDHVAGPLHHHPVAGADVLAGDLVLVVEGRAGDGDAADVDRLQLGHRG